MRTHFDWQEHHTHHTARRLARLRLVLQPSLYPPVSELGFDPITSPPTLEDFIDLLHRHHGTIKGRLLDQSFSAGVGNWVADEILYQARVHPAYPIKQMDDTIIARVHEQLLEVCRVAVAVNADHSKFPKRKISDNALSNVCVDSSSDVSSFPRLAIYVALE